MPRMHNREERMRFQKACAYLFSPDHARDPAFLKQLDAGMVKQAFRAKAKQYHPDLHGHDPLDLRMRREARFVRIKESYEYLRVKLPDPPRSTAPRADTGIQGHRPFVIGVGGAKGGIGKSLFAANLAVIFAGMGYKTIAVDLDLGGANLHLYLGKTGLTYTVNDFLKKNVSSLDKVLEQTDFGPGLIGGNSSCLGAGNIGFARKLKLMKAVRSLDADVVVADLGGDTAFNVLDFFLSAHAGLVMTTCDPAAYLEAYAFIKVGLYRKLDRIFGPESFYSGPVDPVLRRMIQSAIRTPEPSAKTCMAGLRKKIEARSRDGLRLFDRTMGHYSPLLVVNQAGSLQAALPPVHRIQKVCRASLGLDIDSLGFLPDEPGMRKSARTLVPFVTTPEASAYASALKAMAAKVIGR